MKNNFDRRFFLKASGVCMALPFMASLKGQTTKTGSQFPNRMVFVDVSLGLEASGFFPKQTGHNYQSPDLLKPLSKLKDKFTVLSNIEHIGVTGGHEAQPALLSGVLFEDAKEYREGNISVDMKATEHVGAQTRYPSLHIGIGGGNDRMSWSKRGNAVPMVKNLNELFNMLFVNDSAATKRQRQRALNENDSVIDVILAQSKEINRGLDTEDKAKLDEYLTSVRETEKKLQVQKGWIQKLKPEMKAPQNMEGSIFTNIETQYSIYYDLVLMALKTDSSRIVSMQFPNTPGAIKLPGVETGYHLLSHHGKDKDRLRQLRIVEKYHTAQLSKFLTKLQNTKEGDSNLLEKTSVFMGSSMGNASSHSNRQLPALIAGGGLKHAGHMRLPKLTPLCNLYLTMLQNFGMELEQFGPSTGTINI